MAALSFIYSHKYIYMSVDPLSHIVHVICVCLNRGRADRLVDL